MSSGRAFPGSSPPIVTRDTGVGGPSDSRANTDLRDFFAGQALPRLITRKRGGEFQYKPEYVAELAYQMADAMLRERES